MTTDTKALRAPQPAAQQGEQLVRYCPGCGSIGAIESKYRDCCPDGNEARLIPQALAEKCRDTFRIAIGNLTAAHPSTPAAKANTALHRIIAGVEAALDAAGAPAGTLVERIGTLVERIGALGEDAAQLDWLGNQFVTVRVPLRYGSKECFMGSPTDNDGEFIPWNIRAAIDAAKGESNA